MRALVFLILAACDYIAYDPEVGLLHAPPDAMAPADGAAPMPGACGDSDPSLTVSFAAHIRPLTTRSPGGCSCHASSSTAGFNLGSYESLRRGGMHSGTSIIVPGKPCESILVTKLGVAPPYGARMPYNGPPFFNAAELTLVRDWIAEGALDN
ncbi:MAG: hypothetical protein ACKV2T_28895 [Kofleriaceae bacterium]